MIRVLFICHVADRRITVKGVVVPLPDIFVDAAAYENCKHGAEEQYEKQKHGKQKSCFS